MKTKQDPRHLRRIRIVKVLYSQKFAKTKQPDLPQRELEVLLNLNKNEDKINRIIDQYSTRFSSKKMAKIDLCILQLGVYEIVIAKKEPYRVVIDECIELAKEFGSTKSPNFINGVLGKLVESSDYEKN